MGQWIILLIAMGIANENGVYIPVWAWLLSVGLLTIGIIVTVIKNVRD